MTSNTQSEKLYRNTHTALGDSVCGVFLQIYCTTHLHAAASSHTLDRDETNNQAATGKTTVWVMFLPLNLRSGLD